MYMYVCADLMSGPLYFSFDLAPLGLQEQILHCERLVEPLLNPESPEFEYVEPSEPRVGFR